MNRRTRRTGFRSCARRFDRWETVCLLAGRPKEEEDGGRSVGREKCRWGRRERLGMPNSDNTAWPMGGPSIEQ